ncbi:MAG: hydroxymethylglutaryl-CoA lyase [Oceanococcus sp.]
MNNKITITDVGPRDGLQSLDKVLSPEQRLQIIQALVDAGLKNIEFAAFVSPKAVPAMAGAEQLAARLPVGDVRYTALIPNQKGYELAKAAGVTSMGLVIAASNSLNEKNIRMSTESALAVCEDVLQQAKRDRIAIQIYLSTAWECPFEGAIEPEIVSKLAAKLAAIGAQQLVISDTIGAAHPAQVNSLMQRLVGELGEQHLSCHFHDTRALGMANVYAALQAGITHFDASVGGLGGCPFAPGATGNIATEDLVMMLSMMGYETGIDLDKLLAAGQLAGELTQSCTGGHAYPWLSRNSGKILTY